MSNTTLYFADLSDPTYATIGVDLMALDHGEPTGFGVRRWAWGDVQTDVSWQTNGETPGGEQARRQHPVVETQGTLNVDFNALDIDSQTDAIRLLCSYLDSYGVLVWQPESAAAPMFIDTYPSPLPGLWTGEIDHEGVFLHDERISLAGLDVTIWRHPYPRGAKVTLVDEVTISNAVGDNVVTYDNPGSALSEARLTIEVPGSEMVTQVRAGIKVGDVTEFAADFTGYAITAPNVLAEHWKRVHRKVLTPADPVAVGGRYAVMLTCALDDDEYEIYLKWGASTDGPPGNTTEVVSLDATDLAGYPTVEVPLGHIAFDPESTQLAIEIWARSVGGTDMTWSNITFLPTDTYSLMSSPGYRSGRYGNEIFFANTMASSGTEQEDGSVILDANSEQVTVKPTAGFTLEEGPHVIRFVGDVTNLNRAFDNIGEFRVVQNGSPAHILRLRSFDDQTVAHYGSVQTRDIHFRVTDDTDLWGYEAEYTESTDASFWITVDSIRHWFVPPVTAGRSIALDSGTQDARIDDADGDRICNVHCTSIPRIEPGTGCIAFTIGEPAAHGYANVDERGILPAIDESTSAVVTLEVTPRHLHP